MEIVNIVMLCVFLLVVKALLLFASSEKWLSRREACEKQEDREEAVLWMKVLKNFNCCISKYNLRSLLLQKGGIYSKSGREQRLNLI